MSNSFIFESTDSAGKKLIITVTANCLLNGDSITTQVTCEFDNVDKNSKFTQSSTSKAQKPYMKKPFVPKGPYKKNSVEDSNEINEDPEAPQGNYQGKKPFKKNPNYFPKWKKRAQNDEGETPEGETPEMEKKPFAKKPFQKKTPFNPKAQEEKVEETEEEETSQKSPMPKFDFSDICKNVQSAKTPTDSEAEKQW